MSAKLTRAAGEHLRVPIHSMRWHGQFVRFGWKGTALASDAELAFHPRVKRPEIIIRNRPIRPDTFRRIGPEIGWMKPWSNSQPDERATAYADSRFGYDRMLTGINAWFGPHYFPGVR